MKPSSVAYGEDVRAATAEIWRDGRGWILVTVGAGWCLSIGTRVVYPALVPFLRTEFEMSLTAAGSLLTVLWLSYAVGQFPGGILGDRYGERNMLVFSAVLSMVAVTAVAVSVNLEMLFVGTIIFGFATALFGPLRFTILSDVFPERTGTTVGLTMAAGNVGNTLLPIAVGILAAYATWRLGFGLIAPLFVGVAVALYVTIPKRTSKASSASDESLLETARRIVSGISQRGVPAVVAIQILMGVTYQGFIGFYPTYLIDVKGFSPETAATLFGLFFALAIVVQPLAGVLQDRFGAKRTLITLIGVFFLGLTTLPFANGTTSLVALTVLLSSRTGTGVVNNTFIADVLPDDKKGTGLGLLRSSWMSIAAVTPVLIGILGDRGALREAFVLLAAVAGIALLLTLFILPTEHG